MEDVKTFYGILKVLFSFGAVFFLQFASESVLPVFDLHIQLQHNITHYHDYRTKVLLFPLWKILINFNLLSPLLVTLCIPLYLCLLRPFISHYVPGMLKRMGLGMVLIVISLASTLSMDTTIHIQQNITSCMFADLDILSQDLPLTLNPAFIVIQLTLSALSRMLIYIGVLEFICSQSPYSMKGLLIGTLYAIRGLYQVLAAVLSLPYYLVLEFPGPSCGVYFYLVNGVLGVVAVLVYVCVSRRYHYRERDNLCNVYQYAEDYYGNQHQRREHNKEQA